MSESLWCGVSLRARSHALAGIALVIGSLPVGPEAFAASRTSNYSGELNYATFRNAAARNESVTIRYSPGGTGASAMALARVRNVVIDGACNSACAWSFVRNENACFTPRASFGFHAAHDPGTGRRMNAATTYWLQGVRPSLRGRLQPLLSSSSLIHVGSGDMRRHYADRVCGASKSAAGPALSRRQKQAVNEGSGRATASSGDAPVKAGQEERQSDLLPSGATLAALGMLVEARGDTAGDGREFSAFDALEAFRAAPQLDVHAIAWDAAVVHPETESAVLSQEGSAASATQERADLDAASEFEASGAIRTAYSMLDLHLP